tara:strand:- start:16909 stop:18195 length:1287 start_codon:yes stop_codon:yes gene_type:complete
MSYNFLNITKGFKKNFINKKFTLLLFGNFFSQILLGLTFILISKRVDASEVVDFGRNISFAGVITIFSTLRFELSGFGLNEKFAKKNFSRALIVSSLLSFFLIIVSIIYASFVDNKKFLSLISLCILIFSNSAIAILNKYYLLDSNYRKITLLRTFQAIIFLFFSFIFLNLKINTITLYFALAKIISILLIINKKDIIYFWNGCKLQIQNKSQKTYEKNNIKFLQLFKDNIRNNFSAINKSIASYAPMLFGSFFIDENTLSCYYILTTTLGNITSSPRSAAKEIISKKLRVIHNSVDLKKQKIINIIFFYIILTLTISTIIYLNPNIISSIISCKDIKFLILICILYKSFESISYPFSDLLEIWSKSKKLFLINIKLFFLVFVVWPILGNFISFTSSSILIIYIGMMSLYWVDLLSLTFKEYSLKNHI